MNKPENEMTLLKLEKKESKTKKGKFYYTGFLGFNTVYADEYNGFLYVKIQQWPKKEMAGNIEIQPLSNQNDVPF